MDVVYHLRAFPKLSETFVLNELHALDRRDHRVAVFAHNDPGDGAVHSEFDALDVPVRYADPVTVQGGARGLFRLASAPGLARDLPSNLPDASRDLTVATQLLAFVDDLGWEPDVVHGHFASGMRTGGRLAADELGAAHVVTTHANDLYPRENRPTARRVLDACDRVVTVCEANRRFVESRLGVSTPVDVVPASIRVEKFDPSPSSVPGRVLTVARLTEKKGLRDAVDAVASLREAVPDLTYHVVGEGEQRGALADRIEAAGLDDCVSLLGSVSEARLLRELDEARAFLLPCVVTADGDRDATPVVLKEAMAMGVPPVTTTVAGIPEVVADGETGLLVPQRDPAALAAALERVLTDDAERERLAGTARARAETFDVDRTVEKLEASFEAAGRAARS